MSLPLLNDLSANLKVLALEQELAKLPQPDIQTRHIFAPGLYAREITIPKGVLLTGMMHKHDDLAVVSQGVVAIYAGGEVRILKAPCTLKAKAGLKRIALAHEDTVYTTFHATTETDIEKLEEELFTNLVEGVQGLQTAELRRLKRGELLCLVG